ncbi:dynein light chain Tctex-type protein 2B-like [Planococcus citri]|uniref:dynein light chain Tctex-type protein 2B-like n=1 Tax=Planococcus citri TaxID=170843 RepID=UPI0031FA3F5F
MKMDDSSEVANSRIVKSNEDDVAEFQIRPSIEKRFSKDLAKEIIHNVLNEELSNVKYDKDEIEKLCKNIPRKLKERLRASIDPNYKLIAHVVIGEQRGAGVRSVARCLWDSATDAIASISFENNSVFCVATVYAVYFY